MPEELVKDAKQQIQNKDMAVENALISGGFTIRKIYAAISADPSTVDWETYGGVLGGVLGTASVVGFVPAYGIRSATGAAISSGLTSLGGGILTSNGLGILGWLFAAGGLDLGFSAVVGGTTYYLVNRHRQSVITKEFLKKIDEWRGVKKIIPP